MNKEKLEELAKKLGLEFSNYDLLQTALTHTSFFNENKGKTSHNERLEFLGDAVLGLSMSKYIYENYLLDEGQMSKKRAKLVCEAALVKYAKELKLPDYLLLGHGELQTGGRSRPAIIADAFEALLGAIFLTFGFDKTYEVFLKIVIPYISDIYIKDYKSYLQELVQADKRSISYRICEESGPPHDRTFVAIVLMDNIIMGKGMGKTKMKAEQQAAMMALEKMAK